MKKTKEEINVFDSNFDIIDYVVNTTKPLAYDFYKGDFKAYAKSIKLAQNDYTKDIILLFNKYFADSGFKDKQNIAYRIEQTIKTCRFLKMGYFGFHYAASGFYHVLCLQLIENKVKNENKKRKVNTAGINECSKEDFDLIKLMSYFYK